MMPLFTVSFFTFCTCLAAALKEYNDGGNRLLFDLLRVGVAIGAIGIGVSISYFVAPDFVAGYVSHATPMAYVTMMMFCGIEASWIMFAFFASQSHKGKHPFGDKDKVSTQPQCNNSDTCNGYSPKENDDTSSVGRINEFRH